MRAHNNPTKIATAKHARAKFFNSMGRNTWAGPGNTIQASPAPPLTANGHKIIIDDPILTQLSSPQTELFVINAPHITKNLNRKE
jgi:hypothetical protein